jgi:hypothetical protein
VLGDNIEIYATTTDGDATAVVSGINIGTGTLTSQPSHIGATERVYDTWFTGV